MNLFRLRRKALQNLAAYSRLLIVSLVSLAVLSSCKAKVGSSQPTPATSVAPKETELVVFAAASLKDVFSSMSRAFERQHPGNKVVFNFAGTQELRTQVEQGARLDVFASADQKHMEALRKAARVTEATVFAHNEPVIVVAKESASKVQSLRDLPGLKRLVLGTEEVPIGRYSLQILERASGTLGADFRKKVEAKVVSREMNVRQVLAKVRLGEADAGIVYRTDAVTSKGEVGIVAIDPAINVIAEYPIAVVTEPLHPKLAAQWVTYVLSSAGQKTLQEAGFVTGANAIP